MAKIEIKIGGKTFQAALTVSAIRQIEGQFENVGIVRLLAEKQSVNVMAAVLQAAVNAGMGAASSEEVAEALDLELEQGGGLEGISKPCLDLLRASGLLGKRSAEKK